MSPYIQYTADQLHRANCVDLEPLLRQRGEKLACAGRDKRLASDHSITIRENRWYDHATMRGGLAIGFVQYHYGLEFAEAVSLLLDQTNRDTITAKAAPIHEPLPFQLPPKNDNMRRLFAYLVNERCVDREIVAQFVHDGLLYESCEPSKNGKYGYHNAVFVGLDEYGIARHAHKKSLGRRGFCLNVESSNSEYSFHRSGTSEKLFAFEAPIDLMSYICLHSNSWQAHSYVALCGLSEHTLMKTLELNAHITNVVLCLDNDRAGTAATERLTARVRESGCDNISAERSDLKDWNEDLCKKKLSL